MKSIPVSSFHNSTGYQVLKYKRTLFFLIAQNISKCSPWLWISESLNMFVLVPIIYIQDSYNLGLLLFSIFERILFFVGSLLLQLFSPMYIILMIYYSCTAASIQMFILCYRKKNTTCTLHFMDTYFTNISNVNN